MEQNDSSYYDPTFKVWTASNLMHADILPPYRVFRMETLTYFFVGFVTYFWLMRCGGGFHACLPFHACPEITSELITLIFTGKNVFIQVTELNITKVHRLHLLLCNSNFKFINLYSALFNGPAIFRGALQK